MGKSNKNKSYDKNIPGPGNYETNKTTLNSKGVVISNNKNRHSFNNNPGVGSYNVSNSTL